MVDGERVNLEQCPGDLDMENGDQIDAMVEQQGGKRGPDPSNTPLLTACFNGDVEAARLALDRGEDVSRARLSDALLIACQQGHVDVARLLLDRGCPVEE